MKNLDWGYKYNKADDNMVIACISFGNEWMNLTTSSLNSPLTDNSFENSLIYFSVGASPVSNSHNMASGNG